MPSEECKQPPLRRLGEYLKATPEKIERILRQQSLLRQKGEKKLLGELMVAGGVITSAKLQAALRRQRRDRLLPCKVFEGLTSDALDIICDYATETSIDAGEDFIVQDDPGDCFYILVEGELLVYRVGEYEDKVDLMIIHPVESIGEMGYFGDGRRLASVKAVTGARLLKIHYDDLREIFAAVPSLAINFLDLITERLRQTTTRFEKSVIEQRKTEYSLDSIYEMLDMTEILSLRTGIESQIKRIVATASKVMDAERASLFLKDNFSGELWSMVAEGLESREIRIPVGKGVAGWVAQNDTTVNIGDAYSDPRFDNSTDREMGYKTRNILCGPLKNLQGELVGVIQVINKQGGAFDAKDEALFKAFAYQTAIAVENLELYRKLLADHEKIAILFDVSTSVARTLDLDKLFVKIVNKISKALAAERSSLFLIDRKTDELWSKVAQPSELTEIRFPLSDGFAGYVAGTGEVLNIRDAYGDERFLPIVDQRTGFRTRSVLCAPIINRKGDIIGVTEAINKKEGLFDREDESLIKALASQIAVALENAQLYEGTVDMKNYLASVQDSITNGIVTLDDSGRVVTLNKAAAAFFGFDPDALAEKRFVDILGPENGDLAASIQRVYATNAALVEYDVVLKLPWDKEHIVNINVVPLVGHNDERQGLVLAFEDITRGKRMKMALVRYMTKDIVEQILEDPARQALGGAHNKATVIFSDIRGYTGITENLTAEQTVSFLNEYFSLMVDIIFKNGGVLDKYIGDAIMSVFGVPYVKPDDAVRAVTTAIEMRERLHAFNREREQRGENPIRIGIGICTGDVVSGNIGSERRMDFTVIGDGVNVASRIESLTKYYGADILVAGSTLDELDGRFCTRLIDQVRAKGRQKPVRIYEVLGGGDVTFSEAQRLFCDGFALYRGMDFEAAAGCFEKGMDSDPVSRVFLDRCRHFMRFPPGRDWDGVWVSGE
ncbi:MAG: GAF domain-containing protein [Deltaproteobacteria bacterium]|nr:GAF domain-containing protein [Deltaproteobacteria bacterium]